MYFIDIDTRESKIYLVPMQQAKGLEFVIEVESRYMADDLKRKLISSILKGPLENKTDFKEVSIISKLGKNLKVFKFLG